MVTTINSWRLIQGKAEGTSSFAEDCADELPIDQTMRALIKYVE